MKFLSVQMPAFGPFTEFDLEFGKAGLQVVYGPNESGKSSSLRAFRSLLFGMPKRTSDDFIHPYQKLRVGARLVHSSGENLEVQRRKGNKGTLQDAGGETLEESVLRNFIGNLTEEVFERLYGLDHRSLSEGGAAILAEGGKVGESLFAANVGPEYREVRQALRKEIDELWLPRGRNNPLNKAISDYNSTQKRAREVALQVSKFEALQEEIATTSGLADAAAQELGASRARRQLLQNQKQALVFWARYRELEVQLEAFSGLPELPEDFSARRESVMANYEQYSKDMERLKAELSELEKRLQDLPESWPLLEVGEALEKLYQKCARIDDVTDELPTLSAKLQHFEDLIQNSQTNLGWQERPEEGTFADSAVRQNARTLASEFQSLTQSRTDTQENLHRLQSRLQRQREELTNLAPTEETAELTLLVERARQGSLWEERLEELRQACRSARRELETELANLPYWSGDLSQLRSTPVPTSEEVDSFAAALQRAQMEIEAASSEVKRAERALRETQKTLYGLEAAGSVPTAQELATLRNRRDGKFSSMIDIWESGKSRDEASSEIQAFEIMVLKADSHADLMTRDASRVARHSALQKSEKEQAAELNDARKGLEQKEKALLEVQTDWEELWQSVHLSLRGPQEMRRWLEKRQSVIQKHIELEDLTREGVKLDSQRKQLLSELIQGLGQVFPTHELPFDSLTHTLSFAREKLSRASESNLKASGLRENIATTLGELESYQAKDQVQREQLTQWKVRWDQATSHFSLERKPTPQALDSILEEYEQLQKHLLERDNLQYQLERLQREVSDFKQVASELSAALPGADIQSPVTLVQMLYTRLQESREEKKTRQALSERKERLEKEREAARRILRKAQDTNSDLLAESQADSIDEFPEIERKVAQRARLREKKAEVEETLRSLSQSATLEEFTASLAALDSSELESELERLAQRILLLETESTAHQQKIGELRQQHLSMDGSDQAAVAAEEAAQIQTEGMDLISQLIRLTLAESLLKTEIKNYRIQNEQPLIKRSADYFSRLTCGEYVSLRSAYDEDKEEPVLEAVSKSGREVRVGGMSEGTRDQLFLSLRLATIEQRSQNTEPFPLIADDILVHFDEERALATLGVLAEFAKEHQVLLFTHLSRDRDLASQLDDSLVCVKTLERIAL